MKPQLKLAYADDFERVSGCQAELALHVGPFTLIVLSSALFSSLWTSVVNNLRIKNPFEGEVHLNKALSPCPGVFKKTALRGKSPRPGIISRAALQEHFKRSQVFIKPNNNLIL